VKSRVFLPILLCFGALFASAQHNVKIYDLLNELKYATQDTTKVDLFIELAKQYYPSDVTKAIGKAELALVIINNKKDTRRSFNALAILIDAHQKKQDLVAASKYLTRAQSLDVSHLTLDQKAQLFGLEGSVFLSLEEFDKAQRSFRNQLKIYENDAKYSKSLELAKVYFKLGELNSRQGEHKDAIVYYEKSLNITNNTNNIESRIETLNALGEAYSGINNFQKGLDYCNDALYLSESLDNKTLIGEIYLNVAEALIALDRTTEALEKLEQAQINGENTNNHNIVAKAKFLQGKVQISENSTAALKLYQEALDISWLSKNKVLTRDIYEALYKYYDANNDNRNAFFYLKGFINMRDSLHVEDQSKEYIINKIKFEVEEKEAENQRLVSQQLENQITIQRQRTSNYILFTLLVLGGLFAYVLYQKLARRKAYNELLENEVHRRTEQLQASNEELLQANQKLEQSNAELERFAYIASHDLKSPLRNIISFMNLIQRKLRNNEDKDLKEYLRFVTENAQQMNILIQDVLEFSRIDVDANNLRKEKIDLNDTLMLAAQNLQEIIKENKGEIITEKLPTINANSVHLLQLFQNLIGNGLRYNQQKTPTVEISHKEMNNQLILSIKDNGIGISPQYHEQIFEMFKRLHTRDEYKGTGIGLAICKKIVHNFGGRMWLESEVGKGSTFYISIPIEDQQQLSIAS
jgi:signal transduction histidine kinase